MPTTLVHIAAQLPATRALIRTADVKWVLLGAALPDIPWIARRIIEKLVTWISPLDMQAYSYAQASLLMCVVLAAGLALLSRWPVRTFATLALGSLMHLLLDSLELKYGNGVHLLAPLDWHLFSLELVLADGKVAMAINLLVLPLVGWLLWRAEPTAPPDRLPAPSRMAVAAALMAAWLGGPALLAGGPYAADAGSIHTLRHPDQRAGRAVAFDRRPVSHEADGTYVVTVTGERIRLTGPDLSAVGQISLKGRFTAPDTVEVMTYDAGVPGLRDLPTYLGLLLVALWWARDALTLARRRLQARAAAAT
jgi:hypothetical protein